MNFFRVGICSVLALSLALVHPLAFAQTDILADVEPDVLAPVISVKEINPPTTERQFIRIVAQAADNAKIDAFNLFYRAWGGGNFESTPFVTTRNGTYEATIAADKISGQKLEYYIEATDGSGNIAMHGSSLSPRSFDFSASNSAGNVANIAPEPAPLKTPQKENQGRMWMWILGGVAAALVVGFAGGGGANPDGGDPKAPGPDNPTGTVSPTNLPTP